VSERKPTFLWSGPGDGEIKWLTKHEVTPLSRFPDHAVSDPISMVPLAPIANHIDIAAYFERADFVYQPLTSIRKD
jgi:hypothetical protein